MKQVIAGVLSLLVAGAYAHSGPIKIGEINSYSSMPQFTKPYRQGWQLAVDEVNATGGLLGRQVVVISRDDAGKPEEVLRHAVALTASETVDVLAGVTAMRGLKFSTPFGPAEFRALDQQSTLGAFVGKLDQRGGKGTMVQWRYADGKAYMPRDDYVLAHRPAAAMK